MDFGWIMREKKEFVKYISKERDYIMLKQSKRGNSIEYRKYLKKWLDGIENEIRFWDNYLMTRGSRWKSTYNERTKYKRKFIYEQYLNESSECMFLEAGSGPLPPCGSETEKTKLCVRAIDPLAFIYKNLLARYNVKTKIVPEYGVVECLSEKYDECTFDLIHISNALDHSFDPLLGISQMLYVCKVNGKIILEHIDNEAEKEKYRGFHQWNLEVKEGKFRLWREDYQVDIGEYFNEYADISVEDATDKDSVHSVIMTKKKLIPLREDEFGEIYREIIFEKLLCVIMSDYLIEKYKKSVANDQELMLYKENDMVIFGAGQMGMLAYNYLKENVLCICDNDKSLENVKVDDVCIMSVCDAVKLFPKDVYLIANKRHQKEMTEQLLKEGVPQNRIRLFPRN